MIRRKEVELGGTTLSIEMGRIAKQADGAALVRVGDTMVLVAACGSEQTREGIDFLPLTVDYRESFYASGKIPGGFLKREGRANDKEVLTSRLIDRPIRPLFPDGWYQETQVIATVLSADQENDSDVLAITGASTALYCSNIPFTTPIAGVRVGLIDGDFVINPTFEQLKSSSLNLIVAGSRDAIVMVEAAASEVSESQMVDALAFAHEAIRKIVAIQEELYQEIQPEKLSAAPKEYRPDFYREIEEKTIEPLREAMRTPGKLASARKVHELKGKLMEELAESEPEEQAEASAIFYELEEKILRTEVIENGHRLDGRRFDEIRPINNEVGVLPRTHGSSLFTRGETQALVTVTLATLDEAQRLDWLQGASSEKRFMLHYNFPPYSVGEVKNWRGPGRREVGHGALAERSWRPSQGGAWP
jgi:polyribonucleotide nucleotidyltransferase